MGALGGETGRARVLGILGCKIGNRVRQYRVGRLWLFQWRRVEMLSWLRGRLGSMVLGTDMLDDL